MRDTLKRGGRVSLVGFGGFEVRSRKARMGRNPRTGRALTIKARRVPAFRAGRALKEAVNR
jgi:DNA-binding protein HU-beta